ncbi:MAG: META domain-containing protein [Candidatus Nanopelagicales bacterium]
MKRIVVGVLATVVMTGCSAGDTTRSQSPTSGIPTTSATGAPPQGLAPGSDWILVGPNTPDVRLAGRNVTLRFGEDGTVSGRAPVNTYSGPFTADDDGALELGPITQTEMGSEDPDLMAAESQYFQALGLVDGFDTDGEQLFLRTGDTVVLRYGLEGSAAVFGATLIGRTVAKARARAEAAGYGFRVVSVDGESKPVTMDYQPDRLNATVVDGRVTDVTVG